MRKLPYILALFLIPATLLAKETILSFHSDILIQKDSSMLVTESITVLAEHVNIRRGIFRDFPTKYQDRLGHNYEVGFKLVSVERNNRPEPYHTKYRNNGIRIYIGNRNNFIPRGKHTYKLIYETNRQLGYFDTHDELYWNVTGNGWRFPILKASAQVTLPDYIDTNSIKTAGYTGYAGSKEKAVIINVVDGKHIYFETNRTLLKNEGLSLVTGWPKGYVQKPSFQTYLKYFLDDNPNVIAGIFGILIVFIFYYLIWRGVGRDKLSPITFPIYKPPRNFSPAACRYLMRMEYDNKTFATAIVALAIKGYLKISKSYDGYSLLKLKNSNKSDMAAGEYALFSRLFKSYETLPLDSTYHETISSAIEKHKKSLTRNYNKVFFVTNRIWVLLGALLSFICLIIFFNYTESFIRSDQINIVGFFVVVGLLMFSHFISIWLSRLAPNVTTAVKFGFIGLSIAIGTYLILPISLVFVTVVSLIISLNFIFYELLKTPTRAGRPIIEKLLGLKHYLDVAEGDEINIKYAPEKTPETFEFFFPYAMALDVEKAWGAKFAALFIMLAQSGQRYTPDWNDGSDDWDFNNSDSFTSTFSDSLTSNISSSSVAPGSSSGFSGGGGSGGGGGGGGGGGW